MIQAINIATLSFILSILMVSQASASAAMAVLDGHWHSREWRYGYEIKNGVGKATSTNSPNFQVGQEILFLEHSGAGAFKGRQVYTDGRFYAVTAVLQPNGELHFSGERNARWVMRKVSAAGANPSAQTNGGPSLASAPSTSPAAPVNKNPVDLCVDRKIALFKKDMGNDAMIRRRELDEWEEDCKSAQTPKPAADRSAKLATCREAILPRLRSSSKDQYTGALHERKEIAVQTNVIGVGHIAKYGRNEVIQVFVTTVDFVNGQNRGNGKSHGFDCVLNPETGALIGIEYRRR
jgi:hypothetical protein